MAPPRPLRTLRDTPGQPPIRRSDRDRPSTPPRDIHPSAASRGHVLNLGTDRERPLVVLVGGATGVGKSTLAETLATELALVRVVTTDAVREVLRGALPEASYPHLHVSTFETGDMVAFADAHDPAVAGFLAQTELVMQGTAGLLRRALVEGTDIIVEGVHLVPGTHDLPDELEATVVPLVITVDDEETHRCYLEARASAGRPPDRYIQHLDEIRRIHHEVVRRAQDHGVPQVSSTTPEQTASEALAVVAERTR